MSPKIAIIVPAYNAASTLESCLEAVSQARSAGADCFVVDDGSTDATRQIVEKAGAKLLSTGGRHGPGHARNLAAQESDADILWFVDADVCVHADAMPRILAHFEAEPDLAAVMGAYDDLPIEPNFLSQYRNLMHRFYHHSSTAKAHTFWAGCGAIRRHVFLAEGGFSAVYSRAAIEDIELGSRLSANGHMLRLDPAIQGKHLKRWTFRKMLRTDFFDRALPWTELILRNRSMPNHLNLKTGQRVSVGLTGLMFCLAVVATTLHGAAFLAPLTAAIVISLMRFWIDPYMLRLANVNLALPIVPIGLMVSIAATLCFLPADTITFAFLLVLAAIVAINFPFYSFIAAKRGWFFASSVVTFHLLYFFYSGVAFAFGLARHSWRRSATRLSGIVDRPGH